MRPVRFIFIYVLSFIHLTQLARALDVTGELVVRVHPAAVARVRVQSVTGQQEAIERSSGADGVARFPHLIIGDYTVLAIRSGYNGERGEIRVSAGGITNFDAQLTPRAIKTTTTTTTTAETTVTETATTAEEPVIVVRASRILVNTENPTGVGNRIDIARGAGVAQQLATNGTQAVVSYVPGIQTNSLGQFHARGEHKGVGISLDGINIPLPAEDATSQIIDPRLLQTMEVQTGFFDTSVGGQVGAVLNLKTLEGSTEPFAEFIPTLGTYDTHGAMIRAGGSANKGKTRYFFGGIHTETANKLEPVQPYSQTLGNQGRDTNFLFRLSHLDDKNHNQYGFTASYFNGRYGVPQTRDNFLAGVEQNQEQFNFVGVLSMRHQIDESSDYLAGITYLRAHQTIGNNGVFTPYTVSTASEELEEEGLPANPESPGSPYLPVVDRIIHQLQPSLEFNKEVNEKNHIKVGANINFIVSNEFDSIVDAGGGGSLPSFQLNSQGLPEFVANIHRTARVYGIFYSQTLKTSDKLTINYGIRGESYEDQNLSTGQASPRFNASYALTPKQALKLSYNRLFLPPPVENDTTGQSFAIPQRTHQYELAYEFQPADNMLGRLAGVYKEFSNQLDVGLLVRNSNIPLFGPLNFGDAYYRGLEFSLNSSNKFGWNEHFAATVFAVAKPTSPGPFTDELPSFNDHDQRTQITGAGSYTWKNGLTATADALYGSGFPQEAIGLYNQAGIAPFGLFGARFHRFITNLSFNYVPRDKEGNPKKNGTSATLVVQNLNDSREVMNFLSEFSGTRWVQGRRALLSATFRF